MINIPEINLGVIAVSRDCFPESMFAPRRKSVTAYYSANYGTIYECPVVVTNENDMMKAVEDVNANKVNALVVYLGNFGPETAETLIAKWFEGPVMFLAAAEENIQVLAANRGDAYCGMLNCSYNLDLRNLKGYIPSYPVGNAVEVARMIVDFVPLARVVLGLKSLKIIAYGPRPQDFLACNAHKEPL
ncbi:MAG: hypothetical protein PHQ40_03000 [Anaerolineaceae bacterium]|nr:hypothetical protein [Anaerolineaceae bacterium]